MVKPSQAKPSLAWLGVVKAQVRLARLTPRAHTLAHTAGPSGAAQTPRALPRVHKYSQNHGCNIMYSILYLCTLALPRCRPRVRGCGGLPRSL